MMFLKLESWKKACIFKGASILKGVLEVGVLEESFWSLGRKLVSSKEFQSLRVFLKLESWKKAYIFKGALIFEGIRLQKLRSLLSLKRILSRPSEVKKKKKDKFTNEENSSIYIVTWWAFMDLSLNQSSNVAQSILKQLMESPKAGIVLKENPLYDNSDSASNKSKKEAHPDVMSVMMADITVEAAMAELERKVNFLMKVVEERDHVITTLREQMRTRETAKSSQTPVVKATDKGKNVVQENQPQQQSVSVASLSVQQLQDMITNSIRAQYGGPPQTSFMYSKPYTKRIDNLRMPLGYQPPKFQQFDGKGNPKQHVAHFVETCESAGSRGDQLVKQFV
ncbi:ty3-gypsy retrotransposon protein [Cucumis melo var. makuwa]|uniref:Ty3-gypsy retrotransposon protein n=1 Tax=Cucumis melo var. makuwa TaxID=1194695 RepID=A0A5A7U2G2_CUCMM|nr:ty3-gypsy retrotransposon protein [Cucumis melo var. makuwa]